MKIFEVELRAKVLALIIGLMSGGVNTFLTEPPISFPLIVLVVFDIVAMSLVTRAYPGLRLRTWILGAVLGVLVGNLTSFWVPMLMGGILYPFTEIMNSDQKSE